MHAHTPPAAARSAAGLPPHALPLPTGAEVRLFADATDAGWLVAPIAAHQVLPEVAGLGLQCWALDMPERGSARLTCQGWRDGPVSVSLLVPVRCLPLELRRVAGAHEFLVAAGVLWTEAAWCRAGEGGA